MHLSDTRLVIAPTMVANGEAGNRVYVACLQRTLELLTIEECADFGYMWRCMKVEMDLSVPKFVHFVSPNER
jgi:hypothetical protein